MTLGIKPCPFCGEQINRRAKKCIRCNEYVSGIRILGKTVWDWMELLIIPITLTLLGFGLSFYQSNQEAIREANRSAAQARIQSTTEANRANSNALESYLDDMSVILMNENLEDNRIKTAARVRTVTILGGLDSTRNNRVIRFLRDANMLTWILVQADLRGADLEEADLYVANLKTVNLRSTNLKRAHLYNANLHRADLTQTDLRGANLTEADLTQAILVSSNMTGANLYKANLTGAFLACANLRGANLGEANLQGSFYSSETIWPEGFDPQAIGAVIQEIDKNVVICSDWQQ